MTGEEKRFMQSCDRAHYPDPHHVIYGAKRVARVALEIILIISCVHGALAATQAADWTVEGSIAIGISTAVTASLILPGLLAWAFSD